MPIEVRRLSKTHIILVTYSGKIEAEMVQSMIDQLFDILDKMTGRVYRIIDVRKADPDTSVSRIAIRIYKDDTPYTYDVYVGTPKLYEVWNERPISNPNFVSIEAYKRWQMKSWEERHPTYTESHGEMFMTMIDAARHIASKIREDSQKI